MVDYYRNFYTGKQPGNNFRDIFFGRNALSRLLLINLAVFIFLSVARLSMYLLQIRSPLDEINPVSRLALWLAVPASLHDLAAKPWTVITYMFTHESLLHIFFNMLMFYFSGRIFIEYLGSKKLTATYLLGGLVGALFYITAFNVFPAFSSVVNQSVALGASASVLAVLVGIATFIPDYTLTFLFVGRIKLKYIAIIFVVVDILSIESSNPGGHIAHLGGALWGFIYVLILKKGRDMTSIFNPVSRFFRNLFKPRPKLRTSYSRRPMTDDEYNARRAERQQKTDAILDKIAKSGYDSLTKEEKEFLFRASKNEL
jgi:membrane associated rhomboid family serine protease